MAPREPIEDPDFGVITNSPVGQSHFEVESAWCKRCYGEDGQHEPGCVKQN